MQQASHEAAPAAYQAQPGRTLGALAAAVAVGGFGSEVEVRNLALQKLHVVLVARIVRIARARHSQAQRVVHPGGWCTLDGGVPWTVVYPGRWCTLGSG